MLRRGVRVRILAAEEEWRKVVVPATGAAAGCWREHFDKATLDGSLNPPVRFE
jgi:hypothetical protein